MNERRRGHEFPVRSRGTPAAEGLGDLQPARSAAKLPLRLEHGPHAFARRDVRVLRSLLHRLRDSRHGRFRSVHPSIAGDFRRAGAVSGWPARAPSCLPPLPASTSVPSCSARPPTGYGRRPVFVWSLVGYSICTLDLAFQGSGFGADLWRFLAGVALGVELVTIDTYISELIPARERGRAFAANQFITFCAVPIVALLGWQLVPYKPFGFDGWRWVVLIGAVGAIVVFWIQRRVPEIAALAGAPWPRSRGRAGHGPHRSGCGGRARHGAAAARAARPRGRQRRHVRRDLAAAVPAPHHHDVGVQLLPEHRLLRLRLVGADAADRQGHPHHHQPRVRVHHRGGQSAEPADRHADRRQDGAQVADRHRRGLHRGVRAGVLPAEQCRVG